jgi:glycosyltransferase involved in cell wall biosynthesis
VLAGKTFPTPEHIAYFRDYVAPRLGKHGCQFVGPVAGARKRQLIRGARCVIVSTLIPETSSLVAREALAAGTPVVALDTPALHQLIEPSVTGFLVHNVEEMADAVWSAADLDPEDCLRTARARCVVERMIAEYMKIYEELSTRSFHTPHTEKRERAENNARF